MLTKLKNEPVMLMALVEAIIAFLVAMGVLDTEVGATGAGVVAVLLGGSVRRVVSPVAKLAERPDGPETR